MKSFTVDEIYRAVIAEIGKLLDTFVLHNHPFIFFEKVNRSISNKHVK